MIQVPAVTPALLTVASGSDAGTSASGEVALGAGQSPFQALLAPTNAVDDAAVLKPAPASNAAAAMKVLAPLAADAAEAANADGNDLPVALPLPAALAAGATPVAFADGTTARTDPGVLRATIAQTTTAGVAGDQSPPLLVSEAPAGNDLERFSSGPHRLPGLGLQTAALAPAPGLIPNATPLARAVAGELHGSAPGLPSDLTDAAAPDPYLERFSSGPHRLPPTALAAFAAVQLMKFGEGAGRPATAAVADRARSAVDVGLSPALTPAAGNATNTASAGAAAAGFGQAPNSAAWGQALDQQVMLMLNRGAQEARIRLHPKELGQLDIRLSMGGDRVDLNFSVQHASVAGALQQHLPQLTQMLADQGLSLGQASVSHEQAQSGSSAGHGGQSPGGNGSFATPPDGEIEINHLLYQPTARGLLDIFA